MRERENWTGLQRAILTTQSLSQIQRANATDERKLQSFSEGLLDHIDKFSLDTQGGRKLLKSILRPQHDDLGILGCSL
jgi:hypothetical protein